jgi:hypothetical protein
MSCSTCIRYFLVGCHFVSLLATHYSQKAPGFVSSVPFNPLRPLYYILRFSRPGVLRGEPGIPRGWTRYKIMHSLSPIRLVQREVVRCYQSMEPSDASNFDRQTQH